MSKVKIASAVQQNGAHSNLNLSNRVLTTCKIGQILPVYHQECVPGDSFRVTSRMFSRFAPLAVPSYVRINYRTLSVFVPYHQVFDGAESYFDNQTKFKGLDNGIPYFTPQEYYDMLHNVNFGLAQPITDQSAFDYKYNSNKLKLTAHGKYVDKFLRTLGYKFNKDLYADRETVLNALPLLACCHAYNSFMSYAVNYNKSILSKTLEEIKRRSSNDNKILAQTLYYLVSNFNLTYEDNYITNAWSQPYSPTVDNILPYRQSYLELPVPASSEPGAVDSVTVAYDNANGPAASTWQNKIPGYDYDFTTLTAQQVRMMLKFDDFFRRSNYAGSKDIEQIYARFGRKIDDYKTRYPYFLGESSQSVQIGDVTSTSDTDGAALGEYAGKAIGSDTSGFNFSSNDYGMLFMFGWLCPDAIYANGYDKEVLRINPFDFYTPELDHGFASPVPFKQLSNDSDRPNNNFGYVPLYTEYLYSHDVITGDFERLLGFEAWHFNRTDMNIDAWSRSNRAQSDGLIYMPNTGTQFERIFNITDPTLIDVDTCYLSISNEVHAVRPMKDFAGKTELGEGDVDMDINGTSIS